MKKYNHHQRIFGSKDNDVNKFQRDLTTTLKAILTYQFKRSNVCLPHNLLHKRLQVKQLHHF